MITSHNKSCWNQKQRWLRSLSFQLQPDAETKSMYRQRLLHLVIPLPTLPKKEDTLKQWQNWRVLLHTPAPTVELETAALLK